MAGIHVRKYAHIQDSGSPYRKSSSYATVMYMAHSVNMVVS